MTVYRFGDVEVDAEAFQARRAGVPVPLEPKALELLLLLVRSEGRLVTKAALLQAVWPGTFVTESALTRLVAQLRKGLGDDVQGERYIETVPTRGYRFVARLKGSSAVAASGNPNDPAISGPATTPFTRRWTARVAVGAGIVTVAIASLFVLLTPVRRASPPAIGPPTGGGRMLVSTAPGFNAYPAFSPDGSSLAFTSDRTGALEIWIRPLVPGARELQVTSDGQNNLQPAFSPDGRLLAYTSLSQGGIWVVPALGGVPRQVTTFGSRPTWSPDGSTLAFLSNDMVQIDLEGSSTSRIWLVPSGGGTPRPLTARWDPPGGHRSVTFAPDGRRLAFTAGGNVWLLDLATGKRERVEFLKAEHNAGVAGLGVSGEVRWSRDGRSLIGLGRQRNEVVFWRYDLDEEQAQVSSLMVVAEPMKDLEHLTLGPDGRRMAFSLVSTLGDLLSLPLGHNGIPTAKPAPLFPSLASRKTCPQFSRDGSRVSFQVWRPGEGAVVYTASSDGQKPAQAGNRTVLAGASFDPQGHLVMVTRDGQDQNRLVEIDPATGLERTLRDLPSAGWMRLAPDGNEVAFMCGGEPLFAVCAAGARGGEPRRLVASDDGVGWPAWSPDGRQLAVEVYEGEETYVAVVPRSGGVPRQTTHAPGQSWPHSWTPDGRSVVFAGQRKGIWNVYAVEVATGQERRLTPYDRAVVNVRYPAWSPAGDRVVFEYSEVSSNVWVAPLPRPSDAK
jgi:Tol biopolymer transport system component/DNA-binding winged helix-turn-helix (wHTH) protein